MEDEISINMKIKRRIHIKCEHNCRKSRCRECKTGICEHDKYKYECRLCKEQKHLEEERLKNEREMAKLEAKKSKAREERCKDLIAQEVVRSPYDPIRQRIMRQVCAELEGKTLESVQLEEMNQRLLDKDATIQEKDEAAKTTDEQCKRLRERIQTHESSIFDLELRIRRRDTTITDMKRAIRMLEQRLDTVKQLLPPIDQSAVATKREDGTIAPASTPLSNVYAKKIIHVTTYNYYNSPPRTPPGDFSSQLPPIP